MTLKTLYDIAEQDNIDVCSFQMNECESISLLQDGECFIAIDPFSLNSETDEKIKLAHELGHCERGAFYNQYATCDIREKHERRANIWAIKKLIPKDELIEAIKSGFGKNRWELSEYFNVPEDIMQFALDYYKETA